MSTICRIVFGLLLWANLFSISYPPDVAAFPPSDIPDTLDAELELLLPEMIPTGAAFRATFTVTVNQPIKHLNDEPDKVGIAIPRCCIVDSGSCEWRGILDKGVSVSLTVILRAQSSCVDYFEGYVKASCYQQEPVTYATMVRTVSREYRISAEPVSKPQSTMDSTIGIHVVDTVSTGVPQSVAVKDWRKRIRQNDQYVSVDSLKTGRATVFYIAGSDNCVGITDSLQDRANRRQPLLRAEFRCPTAGIGLKRLIGGAVRIDMKDGIDEATIEVTIDKELYHLKVVRRSSSMVSGQFRWINNYGSEVGGSGFLWSFTMPMEEAGFLMMHS